MIPPLPHPLRTLLAGLVASAFAVSAQATEFRSADTHNADDYPTSPPSST